MLIYLHKLFRLITIRKKDNITLHSLSGTKYYKTFTTSTFSLKHFLISTRSPISVSFTITESQEPITLLMN